jgi:hypothetical protein
METQTLTIYMVTDYKLKIIELHFVPETYSDCYYQQKTKAVKLSLN